MPGLAAAQVQQEVRRRDEAMAAMEALRRRLHRLALAVGVAAPLVLAGLYLGLLRPLFGRLAAATGAAEALAAGAPAPGPGGHDELGLLLARVRRVAARVARDRARLNATVAERTAALSRANARLARIDAARRRFFADVGHELRTPLTVILGEAELGAAASRRRGCGRASPRSAAGRCGSSRRIEDLLRIARSESGQLELERRPVDLAAVAAAALADAAPLLARAGVDGRGPRGCRRWWWPGTRDWLRQVFGGLLENAAKYAGRGTAVTIAGRAEAGLAVVTVADDGAGLPPERLEAVFERFGRGAAAAAPGLRGGPCARPVGGGGSRRQPPGGGAGGGRAAAGDERCRWRNGEAA